MPGSRRQSGLLIGIASSLIAGVIIGVLTLTLGPWVAGTVLLVAATLMGFATRRLREPVLIAASGIVLGGLVFWGEPAFSQQGIMPTALHEGEDSAFSRQLVAFAREPVESQMVQLDHLAHILTDAIRILIGMDIYLRVEIWVYRPPTGHLELVYVSGWPPGMAGERTMLASGPGVASNAWRTGQTKITDDANDPLFIAFHDQFSRKHGSNEAIAASPVPDPIGDTSPLPVGVVCVASRAPRVFDSECEEPMELAAEALAGVVAGM